MPACIACSVHCSTGVDRDEAASAALSQEDRLAGKCDIKGDENANFRFRPKACNGEMIASSKAYNSKATAPNGIEPSEGIRSISTPDATHRP
ncbi:YegP family protein [Microbacterium sp.]|uniref:YegP family protein n=1 Tax=Microbacterium sp. TaxID=51671 RepID=UPI003F6E8CEF